MPVRRSRRLHRVGWSGLQWLSQRRDAQLYLEAARARAATHARGEDLGGEHAQASPRGGVSAVPRLRAVETRVTRC